LWGGNGPIAAERFQALMKKDANNPEYIAGYIDSLSTLKDISADQEKAIRTINAKIQTLKTSETDPQRIADVQKRLLSNMGRIMAKLSLKSRDGAFDKARSRQLYMQAIAMDPQSRALWQRYAQSLFDMREFGEADQILTSIIAGDVPTLPKNGN
jgi:predicted Zn-dependent protease